MAPDAPLVFLDLDGVLNSARFMEGRAPGCQDFIDRAAVEVVNEIVARSGALVVVSSKSWNLAPFETDGELETLLRRYGFRGNVAGRTPRLWRRPDGERLERGHEIAAWRQEHGHTGPFVILDDGSDMAELGDHLVQTSFETGLLPEHIGSALQLLSTGKISRGPA